MKGTNDNRKPKSTEGEKMNTDQDSDVQGPDNSGLASSNERQLSSPSYLTKLAYWPAADEEIENYARGVVTGVMRSATPSVVGSLLVRIRQMKEQTRIDVTVERWYVGTMNDGYFVIDAPPQPAPVDYACDMDHGVTVIAACGTSRELAEMLVGEHNKRIAMLGSPEEAFAAGHSAGLQAARDRAESHDCGEDACVCSEEA